MFFSLSCSLSCSVGYSPHPSYGMITQSDYTTGNSNYGYGSIAAAYQSSVSNPTLGGPIASVATTNSSIAAATVNPYASSVIGCSSNGYSNVLSISSGGIPSVSSCYPIPATQHLSSDKNCTKDRWVYMWYQIYKIEMGVFFLITHVHCTYTSSIEYLLLEKPLQFI